MKKAARWLWQKLTWLWGFLPFTLHGLLLSAVAGLGLYYQAYLQIDLVVATLGLSLLGLQVVMSLLVTVRAFLLYRMVRKNIGSLGLTAETDIPRVGEFSVQAWSWLPFVHVSWSWDEPVAEVRQTLRHQRWNEELMFTRRGRFDRVRRIFVVEDVLGLAKVRFEREYPCHLTVFPHAGRLAEPPLYIRFSTGEDISDPRGDPQGDRIDMRQYVRGDSPRTIMWKVYARTRRLMVRVPERALAPRPRVAAYLVTSRDDEPSAALARVVLEKGMLGPGWRFGADGTFGFDGEHTEAAVERIASSAREREGPTGLAGFLKEAHQDGYAQCLVFLSMKEGSADPAARAAIAASPIPITVCMAVDSLEKEKRLPRWYRYLFYQRPDEACTLGDMEKAAASWGGHAGEVMLVDRKAGVMISDLRRYRPKKAASA